jgi:pyruvate,water dikinase
MPPLIELPQVAQVVGLDRLAGSDPAEFGAQNMAVARLHQAAARLGFPVSPGFALPATAFRWYLETTGLAPLISTALSELRTGQEVTLSCAHSELGVVLDGLLQFEEEPLPVPTSLALHTQIHLDLEDPAHAFRLRSMPCDGVGLAYTDFLLRQQVGVHPSALVDYANLPQSVRSRIDSLTAGYADKPEFFVSTLAEGIGRVAAAMFPKPVLVHLNELQSDEYAQLIGGMAYEEREANPMLGLRGASRYSHLRFSGGFALECSAIRRVQAEMGFTNVRVAVPFCRTSKEAQQLLQQISQLEPLRHQEGLEVWLRCELPCNLLLAEEFLSLFDGFLIDIPSLTQLTFGADLGSNPSGYLGAQLQERHPAMARLMTDFTEQAHRARKPVAATGADPGFVRFVVGLGVDSIFAPGNFLLNTRLTVAEAEGAVLGGSGAQIADGFPSGN